MKQKILFITSNPSDSTRLRIDREVREIEESLRRANQRDSFDLITKFATRTKDLSRAILDENPQILHFSGHGEKEGIILEDDYGKSRLVNNQVISGLFGLFKDRIKCVFLNSCYSESQAKEISKYIPFVIGMKEAVPDNTAIAFAISFYDAIGAGENYEFAFSFAKSTIPLEELSGEDIPVLLMPSKPGKEIINNEIKDKTITDDKSNVIDVFISYSHQDIDRARELAKHLGKIGWSVFWDRTIPPGESWRSYIGKALQDAKCVIVLWSNDSVNSNWVIEEANKALRRHAYLPVLINQVDLPFGFGEIQAIDLTNWQIDIPEDEGLQLLFNTVKKIGNFRTGQEEKRIDKEQTELKHKQEEVRIARQKEELNRKQEEEKRNAKEQAGLKRKLEEEQKVKEKTEQIPIQIEEDKIPKPLLSPKNILKYLVSILAILTLFVITFLLIFQHKPNDSSTMFFKARVKDIDGNEYKTVTISSQIWMKEYLRTTKFNDGTPIRLVTDKEEWYNFKTPGYCWYNNDKAKYGDIYGALYNWYAVNTGKLCPVGWHVPSDAEWKQLEMALGMTQAQADDTDWRGTDQGTQMKTTTGWDYNGNGTNSSGFSALPGGCRLADGRFVIPSNIGYIVFWWSSSEYSTTTAWYRKLSSFDTNVNRSHGSKENGFSVRCLRD